MAITSAQASALHGLGYSALLAQGPVTLSLAETNLLNSAGLKVGGSPVTVAGSLAAVLALTVSQALAYGSEGYTLAVQDKAATIDALTSTQIASLVARHVRTLAALDANLTVTEAQAAALETGGISVSAPAGLTAVVSDAAGNLQKLTAAQISGLPGIGVTGIASTNGSVTLNVSQALALEALSWTIGVPSGDTRTLSDKASAIAAMTGPQIAGLSAIGVTSAAATVSGVTLSVQQGTAFETAGLTLTAPSGASNAIVDTAVDVEGLTAAQVAGLGKLHVTKVAASDAGVTLSAAQAGALVTSKVALSLPPGTSAAIVDAAAGIQALTATQFAGLAGLGVKSIAATDASLALTEAEAVSLETGGISVSVPAGSTALVSDTAGNLQKLTAAQIAGLPGIGFTGIASTTASVTLNASQALALEALGWAIGVPSGGAIRVSDTGTAIGNLSAAQISGLSAIGVTSAAATVSGVTLSVQQAAAFEKAGLTLTAPSGASNTIVDTAVDIGGLTAAQIAGLGKLHVTKVAASDAGVTLSAAQAGALVTSKVALGRPTGTNAAIVDAASSIQALTATQFAALAGLGVKSIAATDASLALTEAEAVSLETGGISVSVPAGSTALVSDTAGNLQKLTAAQIAGLPGIGFTNLYANSANVSFSVAQTSAILASGLTVAASGTDTVTENFANGAYSVFENGALINEKSVNADGSYDVAHFNVSGLGYSSYEDIYTSAGTRLAEARDMSDGSGALLLYGNGVTVNSGTGQLSATIGADTFALDPHANEAITASGHASEVFAYASGFGQSSIAGFAATGASHDVLQVQSAMFGDVTTLLSHTVQLGANVQITDPSGDTTILSGVLKTTLAANPGDFRFT